MVYFPPGGGAGNALGWGPNGALVWQAGGGGGGGGGAGTLNVNKVSAATGALTIPDPTTGSFYGLNWYVMTGSITLTAPPLNLGANFLLWVDQTGSNTFTVTFASSPAFRWVGGIPTAPGGGLRLWASCLCDGATWSALPVTPGY
jgi:hypothetical protein